MKEEKRKRKLKILPLRVCSILSEKPLNAIGKKDAHNVALGESQANKGRANVEESLVNLLVGLPNVGLGDAIHDWAAAKTRLVTRDRNSTLDVFKEGRGARVHPINELVLAIDVATGLPNKISNQERK